jgi:hypothetical protein
LLSVGGGRPLGFVFAESHFSDAGTGNYAETFSDKMANCDLRHEKKRYQLEIVE